MKGARGRALNGPASALITLAQEVLAARQSERFSELPPEIDVRLGTVHGSLVSDREFLRSLAERGYALGSPSTFVQTLSTAVLSELSIALGLHGAVSTISGGDVAGLLAVAQSARLVALGRSAAILCGAIDASGGDADVVALFLLEESRGHTTAPRLVQWTVGFDPCGHSSQTTLRSSLEGLVLALEGSGTTVGAESLGGEFVRLTVDLGNGIRPADAPDDVAT
jgi:hypothetical protein